MASNSRVYGIEMTNNRTFLWRGRENTYKGLTSALGIKEFKGTDALPEDGNFGGEHKPAQVRIRTTDGKSYTRFIATDKIEEQIYKRKLVGKKIKNAKGQDETICYASVKSN